jgi:hypothetical protein
MPAGTPSNAAHTQHRWGVAVLFCVVGVVGVVGARALGV